MAMKKAELEALVLELQSKLNKQEESKESESKSESSLRKIAKATKAMEGMAIYTSPKNWLSFFKYGAKTGWGAPPKDEATGMRKIAFHIIFENKAQGFEYAISELEKLQSKLSAKGAIYQ